MKKGPKTGDYLVVCDTKSATQVICFEAPYKVYNDHINIFKYNPRFAQHDGVGVLPVTVPQNPPGLFNFCQRQSSAGFGRREPFLGTLSALGTI